MDLGKCPRCGEDWPTGDEMCPHCGFIPIGAGLKALSRDDPPTLAASDRKLELDLGIQREPGSRPGLILTACLLILMAVGYDQQVWAKDWEPIRAVLGAPRSQDISGTWTITSSEQVDRQGIEAKVQGLSGAFQFGKNDTVRIHLYRGLDEMEATGLYSQNGPTIHLRNLDGSNGGAKLPGQVDLKVVWRNGNEMQIEIEGEERVNVQKQKE